MTSDQLVNGIQCTFPMQNLDVLNLYLFCKKSNRRLEFNDTGFFFICQYKKEVKKCYKGGGLVEAMYFFAKYN